MYELPNAGFVREKQIIGDRKAKPPTQGILPVGHSTFWKMVREGNFPAPIKLSARVTAWRVEDIRDWMESRAA